MSDNFVLRTSHDDTQVLVRRQPVAGNGATLLLRIDPLRTGVSAAFLTRQDALTLADALSRVTRNLPASSIPGSQPAHPGDEHPPAAPTADPAAVDPWLSTGLPPLTPPADDLRLREAQAAYDRGRRRLINIYAHRATRAVIRAYPQAVLIEIDCVQDPEGAPGYTTLLAVLDRGGQPLASVDYNADQRFTTLDARLSTELGALMRFAPPEDGWYGRRLLALSDFLAW
ncbi:hypothetical protein [Protofrankia symbiont of Coriaria ruscifolia]|uniref:hypothetical protein n=1 Tax=Protofrankia symbiont of Coriaria ruscifolia TaxID=1306542 RepID=UPI0010413D2E|nr:hypothetical protein [Protofrankia symbiont of Coriaria ruscifolia]